ncbi:MAG: hypothetical protein IPK86_00720 [Neisseriales bacterium]|nr:MAG: hypothetical protein IPK86_00720 [Neisseriales bacterium]
MDRESLKKLFQSGMSDSLFKSFCTQISYLSLSPVVQNLVTNLFSQHGFFQQAEVIFSERGSLLFRSCVTANPIITCEALMRLVEKRSDQEIYAITGSVRRNLINALESLCFREDCFQKAAFILLRFAHQENEIWSHNATNLFKQLFRVILSGTQAMPKMRLEFIDGIIHENFAKYHIIAALGEILDTGSRSRRLGAEFQGIFVTLKEWLPKTYGEIFDYQKEAIKRLVNFSEQEDEVAKRAKETLALHICDLLPYPELLDSLDSAIKKIVKIHGGLWHTALKQIKRALQSNSKELEDLAKTKLLEWQALLMPCQLSEKLELFVTNPIYESKKDDTGSYADIATKNVVAFAQECAMDIAPLIPYIKKLNEKRHALASIFACEIVKTSKQWQPLLDLSVKVLKNNLEADPAFFLGLLSGIFCVDPVAWTKFVKNIAQCSELERYLAGIFSTGEVTEKDLSKLLTVLEQHPEWSHTVSRLSGHQSLKKLDIKNVCHFVESLSNISKASAWHALDFLCMYMLRFPFKRDSFTRSTSKKLILKLDFAFYTSTDGFSLQHWSDTIKSILGNPSERQFAKQLLRIFLMDISLYKAPYDTLFNIKEIVEILLTRFIKVTWNVFQEMIREITVDSRRVFEMLLGKELNVFAKRSLTIIERLPMELLVSWCQKEPDFAPQFIARTIEVFHDKNDEVYVSKLADFLLQNCAPTNEEVLRAFGHNLFTYSVIDTLVPYYQRELNGWNSYKYNGTHKVKDWIEKRISYLKGELDRAEQNNEEREF